ncbi:hypothetical protein NIASO_04430 [Niabella soli DSM 19437]|uniref:Uncharacterized protein n=1 Tax=Niabella soli DSM 19437 TaxID=929713 RepID=W0F7B5_9BACT|nr:hypothetical protein NIASO_04430 [Niabella soli DSM 19437]
MNKQVFTNIRKAVAIFWACPWYRTGGDYLKDGVLQCPYQGRVIRCKSAAELSHESFSGLSAATPHAALR